MEIKIGRKCLRTSKISIIDLIFNYSIVIIKDGIIGAREYAPRNYSDLTQPTATASSIS